MTPVPAMSCGEPDALEQAAKALASGAVVAIPTDTVYGLAADPFQPAAVEALFALKGRPEDVALPVLVGGPDQVGALAGELPPSARRLADRHWPGALTLVVPRDRTFTADLGGRGSARQTVAVRWPDDGFVTALCRAAGPLAVTSANRHGEPPLVSAGAVATVFDGRADIALVVDGGMRDGIPSTVVECRGPAVRCLREGTVPWDDVAG